MQKIIDERSGMAVVGDMNQYMYFLKQPALLAMLPNRKEDLWEKEWDSVWEPDLNDAARHGCTIHATGAATTGRIP